MSRAGYCLGTAFTMSAAEVNDASYIIHPRPSDQSIFAERIPLRDETELRTAAEQPSQIIPFNSRRAWRTPWADTGPPPGLEGLRPSCGPADMAAALPPTSLYARPGST